MKERITDTFFYHIYPLGMCGAPAQNDFSSPAGNGLRRLTQEIGRIADLGVNAIYIGPLFESTAHGYDTVDYYHVDRRLGNNADLTAFVQACHAKGINVVLDAVFNHTGRDFFAFKDIQANGSASQFCSWYKNLRFDQRSPKGDNFSYEGWAGCTSLVKLNLENQAVREHLLKAVQSWIQEFDIDGLRLDAADVLLPSFMDELSSFCAAQKKGFWLLGEVVHGDYNNWARPGRLDSVTNYEAYKGLWSSFNSGNFFEIAYSLNRQYGDGGIYRYAPLYNFADNHDVDRIASVLTETAWLYPLYGMLFTVPGIPSIYYGSEYGIRGKRTPSGDRQLRPAIPPFADSIPDYASPQTDSSQLADTIKRLAEIRTENKALRCGDYRQLTVASRQFAFMRSTDGDCIITAVNSELTPAEISIQGIPYGNWHDILNGGSYSSEELKKLSLPPSWLRILKKQ